MLADDHEVLFVGSDEEFILDSDEDNDDVTVKHFNN